MVIGTEECSVLTLHTLHQNPAQIGHKERRITRIDYTTASKGEPMFRVIQNSVSAALLKTTIVMSKGATAISTFYVLAINVRSRTHFSST